MTARRYRKKPVVIEAVQWIGENVDEVMAFAFADTRWQEALDSADFNGPGIGHTPAIGTLDIPTLEGVMTAQPGDWIVRGVQGELSPCKPDVFAATYEPVEDDPVAVTADALRDRIAQALHHEGAYCGNCGYENDIEDCPDCELILYGYARAIERLLADADPADLGMKASGIWYCCRHAGTANEDDPRGLCPWWDHADHCDAEHDEGLDDGACSPCEWVELLIPPAHPRTKETPDAC